MGIKTIILVALLAAFTYRLFQVIRLFRVQDVIYNHEPGPCKLIHMTSETCSNVHSDDAQCSEWASSGECDANRDWMRANCGKACGQCEDTSKPLLGSEDFADVGNGKFLVSSGIKFLKDHFPERKGAVYLFDFNKPNNGVEKAKMILDDTEKVDKLNPHGISSFITSSGKVIIFLVNHDGGEFIERFEYDVNSNTLKHLETISDPVFKFLNSVQPTGERSFYVTNFCSVPRKINFILEKFLGLRFGDIAYFDGEKGRAVTSGMYFPNGIQLSADMKYLYVSHMGEQSVETYSVQEDYSLERIHVLPLYRWVDNIALDPDTGDLWLGMVACPWSGAMYHDDPATPEHIAPAQALRVTTKAGIPTDDVTDVYANKGDVIKASTVAVYYKNQLVIGSLYDTTVYCKVLHV